MSNSISSFFLVILLCLVASVQPTFGQNAVNSIYSRYGLGLDTDPGSGPQTAMGNTGTALRSPILFNPINPASVSALSITTFQAGMRGERMWQRTAADSLNTWRGGFSFLNLGFKLNKGWAAAAGLQPMYSMGFNTNTYTSFGGQTLRNYQAATGGLNKVFLTQAFSPLKWFKDSLRTDISLGISGEFIFGNYDRFRFLSFEGADTSRYLGSRLVEELNNRSLAYTTGIQISHEFGKKREDDLRPYQLTLGFTYRPEMALPMQYSRSNVMYRILGEGTENVDTVSSFSQTEFQGTLPGEWRGGISFSYLHHLVVTYDYSLSDRSAVLLPWDAGTLGKRAFHQAGIQYYPAKKSDRAYLKHTYYRLGIRIGDTGFLAGGRMIKEQAIHAGIGLKLGKKTFSTLNLGFEAARRGNLKNDALQETWLQMNVGIVLNDATWFIKRKFD